MALDKGLTVEAQYRVIASSLPEPKSSLEGEIPGLFALFKGESGIGKTVGAASFPTPHIHDFDRKMPAVVRKHYPNKEIAFSQPKDIYEVVDRLSYWYENGCPYETLIEDSITSLSTMSIKAIGDAKGERIIEMLRKIGSKGNIELMSIDYYNGETRFLQYYIDALKALWIKPGNPRHIIVIAHVITSESAPDLKTKLVTRTRSIVTYGRKIAAYIPAQFDECYHFAHTQGSITNPYDIKRVCITQATGEDFAKTAFKFPPEIDFTNGSLYDKLNLIADWTIPDSNVF